MAPSDSSLALDLADDYLRAGNLAEATRAYEALLESSRNAHATSTLLGLAALQQPNDRELREKALAPSVRDRRAFAAPLPGVQPNFTEFQRQRLAGLSLALRACDDPNDDAFSWALAIASAEDAWAAHSALLALGAASRRSSALAPLVVSTARSALAREDARSLAAAAVQVHSANEHVDAQARGRALTCLVVASVEARQAWLVDRSHRRATLDPAMNDATLQQ